MTAADCSNGFDMYLFFVRELQFSARRPMCRGAPEVVLHWCPSGSPLGVSGGKRVERFILQHEVRVCGH